MKVHREGTGLLLSLFTFLFIVDVGIYYAINKGGVFYTVLCLTIVLFLLALNFFRSPNRHFPYDSEGLVIAPADGTVVAIEEVMENEYFHEKRLQVSIFMSVSLISPDVSRRLIFRKAVSIMSARRSSSRPAMEWIF